MTSVKWLVIFMLQDIAKDAPASFISVFILLEEVWKFDLSIFLKVEMLLWIFPICWRNFVVFVCWRAAQGLKGPFDTYNLWFLESKCRAQVMNTYMGISSELNENLIRNMCCHMLCCLLGRSKISCINISHGTALFLTQLHVSRSWTWHRMQRKSNMNNKKSFFTHLWSDHLSAAGKYVSILRSRTTF